MPVRKNISVYLPPDDLAWLDAQGEARGAVISRLIARGRVAGTSATPDMIAATRALRERLDAIDDAIAEAQDLASEIETVAGLVRHDGSRMDEPTKRKSKVSRKAKPPELPKNLAMAGRLPGTRGDDT